MDRTERYRAIVRDVVVSYSAIKPSYGEVEVEAVLDDTHGHYELIYAGWDDYRRIHGSVLHVDARDGKVWIQHDGTGDGITSELMQAGIPSEHIALAFHPPDQRKLTPFAVG